ncbi:MULTISPECIES: hypothetical protein [unclassified Microcoleus]|uniref:hypothetical protein n=1 Tax=unclassified Microcoleus TaxID=2642155 RepID=UPI002FD24A07
MAALNTRGDRLLWGVANLAIGALAIPFCYGLSSKDFTSFKFLSATLGLGAGLNSVRLFHEHEQGAGVRSAWRASAEMVSGAWIEEIASANLPPSFQAPVYRQEYAGVEKQPVPQFQFAASPQSEDLPERGDGRTIYGKMPGLSWYSSVLAYGIPGAGKTTFIEEEVRKRLAAGHKVIVLDPHAAYGQWEGCEVIGAGMDYEAIDAKMVWFEQENKRRYKIRQTQSNPKFQPLTMVAEEFTNWATRCKFSGEHFRTVNSDIRKVECYSIIVTHTRTLAGLGDAKGMASLRDESMLEVEILGNYDPVTERATPRFEALVKMPGQALSDRTLVKIERHSGKLPHQPPEPSGKLPGSYQEASPPKPENLGTLDGMRVAGLEAILSEILKSGGNATVYGSNWGLNDQQKFELAKLVIECEQGIEKRILYLWGAKSGGRTNHEKYRLAREWLDRLIAQINQSGSDTI